MIHKRVIRIDRVYLKTACSYWKDWVNRSISGQLISKNQSAHNEWNDWANWKSVINVKKSAKWDSAHNHCNDWANWEAGRGMGEPTERGDVAARRSVARNGWIWRICFRKEALRLHEALKARKQVAGTIYSELCEVSLGAWLIHPFAPHNLKVHAQIRAQLKGRADSIAAGICCHIPPSRNARPCGGNPELMGAGSPRVWAQLNRPGFSQSSKPHLILKPLHKHCDNEPSEGREGKKKGEVGSEGEACYFIISPLGLGGEKSCFISETSCLWGPVMAWRLNEYEISQLRTSQVVYLTSAAERHVTGPHTCSPHIGCFAWWHYCLCREARRSCGKEIFPPFVIVANLAQTGEKM